MSDITWSTETRKLSELIPWEKNPRTITQGQAERLVESVEEFGQVETIAIGPDNEIYNGHQRQWVLAQDDPDMVVDVRVASRPLTENERKKLTVYLHKGAAGEWDFSKLAEEFDYDDLVEWGFSAVELEGEGDDGLRPMSDFADNDSLVERFIVPPFTVLDARQGYWRDRKEQWQALGVDGRLGRSEGLIFDMAECSDDVSKKIGGSGHTSSVFDPVLCEVAYRWFCTENGSILDPFAGEATKGVVASKLGYSYTGVELRQEQVDTNRAQAKALDVNPTWICGDSENIGDLLPPGEMYDMIFTSPPYYDLEIYSKSEKDGSAFETYEKFMNWYHEIFAQSVARLRDGRFLVIKIGDIRDDNGVYRNFLGDNISCFLDLGLHYYNEAILITPVGSLPLRVSGQFIPSRKLGKGHQNVLVFYKGDPKKIMQTLRSEFPDDVEYADVSEEDYAGDSE